MTPIGESVDHRYTGVLRQRDHVIVFSNPRHDAIDIATDDLRRVLNRLAPFELQIVDPEEDRVTTELGHARFEGDAGSRARMLEDHTERFARQIAVRLALLVHPL